MSGTTGILRCGIRHLAVALLLAVLCSLAYRISAMNIITDIFQFMNEKAEAFFEWAQAHPKSGLLIVAVLLAVWLTGLLFRWKWASHWQYHGKLWIFDDCKPETKRRIQIFLVSVALLADLILFFL